MARVPNELDLNHHAHVRNHQINSLRAPCGAWRPLLSPHVFEDPSKGEIEKILEIMLVGLPCPFLQTPRGLS